MTLTLWTPITVGAIEFPHRLAMAPMTRDRSRADGVPTDLNREYYRQRASMALIITEGTQPSAGGQGYMLTPGIHTEGHIAGWQEVTGTMHAVGGRIVVQLIHTGRISHPGNTPHGRQPVAPSAIRPKGGMYTASGLQDMPTSKVSMSSTAPGSAQARAAASSSRRGSASRNRPSTCTTRRPMSSACRAA
jgi:N-ethylmaleimide reductase